MPDINSRVRFWNADGTGEWDTLSVLGSLLDANYISNVQLVGTDLTFTGEGSAFNGVIDLSSLNVTYSLSVPVGTTDIQLLGSDASTDAVSLQAGSNITLTRISDSIIQISATTSGGSTQNLWETVQADTGTATAADPNDILSINGGTNVTTSITPDGILTINSVDTIDYISNVSLVGTVLTFTGVGNAFNGNIDLSAADIFLSSGSFDSATGVLTLTKNDATSVNINLDGRYSLIGHGHTWAEVLAEGNTSDGNNPTITYDDTLTFLETSGGNGTIMQMDPSNQFRITGISPVTTFNAFGYSTYQFWGANEFVVSNNSVGSLVSGNYFNIDFDSVLNTGTISFYNNNLGATVLDFVPSGFLSNTLTLPITKSGILGYYDEIGGNNINSNVESPTAVEDGYVITWDNLNTEYVLTASSSGANDYVISASFDTATGNLTLTRTDSGTIVQNLDGRYALLVHTHDWSDIVSGTPTTLSGYGITDALMFRTINFPLDFGFSWGSGDVVADSSSDLVKFVEGTHITIESDPASDGIKWSVDASSISINDLADVNFGGGVIAAGNILIGNGSTGNFDRSQLTVDSTLSLVATDGGITLGVNATPPLEKPTSSGYSGSTIIGDAGEALSLGDLVRYDSSGDFVKASATSLATGPAIGIATASVALGASIEILTDGYIYIASHGVPVNTVIYLSTTAGQATTTPPSSVSNLVQAVGIASSADSFLFKPSFQFEVV